MRRRATAAVAVAAAAVDRKFKIEYLASNFHRSSKNRAVSYVAGGLTLACVCPPRPPSSFISASSSSTHRDRGPRKEKRGEHSPLHTVAIMLRDRLCSDMETQRVHAHVCILQYIYECSCVYTYVEKRASGERERAYEERRAREFSGRNSFSLFLLCECASRYFSAFPDCERFALADRLELLTWVGRERSAGSFAYFGCTLISRRNCVLVAGNLPVYVLNPLTLFTIFVRYHFPPKQYFRKQQ